MKNKSIFIVLMSTILILLSCFLANNIALWLVSIVVIGISTFLLFDLNKNISKITVEVEELKNDCETKSKTDNQDDEIREEIIDVLEKIKIGFLGYKIQKLLLIQKLQNLQNLLTIVWINLTKILIIH